VADAVVPVAAVVPVVAPEQQAPVPGSTQPPEPAQT